MAIELTLPNPADAECFSAGNVIMLTPGSRSVVLSVDRDAGVLRVSSSWWLLWPVLAWLKVRWVYWRLLQSLVCHHPR
jgi:hypothetical protein